MGFVLTIELRRPTLHSPTARIIVPDCPKSAFATMPLGVPMTNSAILLALIPVSMLVFTAADDLPAPPVAKKIPHTTEINGRKLVDNYFWLREQTKPEVLSYL